MFRMRATRTCLRDDDGGGDGGGVCRQYVSILTANRSNIQVWQDVRKKCKQKPHNRTETLNWLHTFALMFHRTRISWHDISSRDTSRAKHEREWKKNEKIKRRNSSRSVRGIESACELHIWINISSNMFLVSSSRRYHAGAWLYWFCFLLFLFVRFARCSGRRRTFIVCVRQMLPGRVWTIARRVTQSILTTWQSIRRTGHIHSMLGIIPFSQDLCVCVCVRSRMPI